MRPERIVFCLECLKRDVHTEMKDNPLTGCYECPQSEIHKQPIVNDLGLFDQSPSTPQEPKPIPIRPDS